MKKFNEITYKSKLMFQFNEKHYEQTSEIAMAHPLYLFLAKANS